jgi:hypothetical protein
VENVSPNLVDICSLEVRELASKDESNRHGSRKIKLFDVGAKHSSNNFENLNNVIGSGKECFTVEPFHSSRQDLLPPGFVQASLQTKDEIDEVYGEILLKGLRNSLEDLTGLQIFINGNWITNIEERDVQKLTKHRPVEIVKTFFPRVSMNWDEMKEAMMNGNSQGKMLVVYISDEKNLDFDIPRNMGIEFIGEGDNVTKLAVVGSLNVYGRASFHKMSVSFEDGSMNIDGPTFFKSSRLVEINRCPTTFIEFNGICYLVSSFIEQADDAEGFCKSSGGASLAEYTNDVIAFFNANERSLMKKARAWIQPIASNCTAIESDGSFYEESEQNCAKYIRVLCSIPLKKPIYGNTYTTYFSDQVVGTYKQDFYKRIMDKDRLPFQLGGTVSFSQIDLDDGSDDNENQFGTMFSDLGSLSNGTILTVPDSRPVAISVDVTLLYGDLVNIEYAFDIYNEIGIDGHLWSVHHEMTSLPTRLQVHAKADVCIANIESNTTCRRFLLAME